MDGEWNSSGYFEANNLKNVKFQVLMKKKTHFLKLGSCCKPNYVEHSRGGKFLSKLKWLAIFNDAENGELICSFAEWNISNLPIAEKKDV